MIKNKFLFITLIFAILSSVLLTGNIFVNNSFVYAEEQDINISEVIKSYDENANYTLDKNKTYSYSTSISSFKGKIKGNGAKIIFDGTNFVPLFNELSGATVEGLNFVSNKKNEKGEIQQQSLVVTIKDKTSYGVLADTIVNNSTVKGIEFSYLDFVINDVENLAVPSLNVGFVAGIATESVVEQIKIHNSNIRTQVKSDNNVNTNVGIRPDSNIAFVVGVLDNGAVLKNILLLNNNMNLTIAESSAKNFNIGAISGLVRSGSIYNTITYLTKNNNIIINFERDDRCLNLGFLAGRVLSKTFNLINHVISSVNNDVLSVLGEEINTAIICGKFDFKPAKEQIEGILTTIDNNFFIDLTYENDKLNFIPSADQINTNLENTENWNVIYGWDYDSVWRATTDYYPSLQYFEEYDVIFSSSDSINTLNVTNSPQNSAIDGKFDKKTIQTKVSYGNSMELTVSISKENNYDKFFTISGLYLNNNGNVSKIYDVKNKTAYNNYSISHIENNGEITFTINNFKFNCSGTYYVELKRIEYKMSLKVLEDIQNDQLISPGKIKDSRAVVAVDKVITMKYGEVYTFETFEVNGDYSKDADWYLTYLTKKQAEDNLFEEEDKFSIETVGADTVFSEGKKTISWVFDENCVLFGTDKQTDDSTNYLSIDDYDYSDEDENSKMFAIYAVFTRDVRDIEIKFKFDDEEQILDKITDIKIDGVEVKNFNNGVFRTKIRFGTKPHTITLSGLETEYVFDGWFLNSRLPGVSDDNFGGSFEVLDEGENATMVLWAVFKKDIDVKDNNLLWLWISLGGVGLAGIVITIIIIKKKNSNKMTYRKYMY